MEIIIQALHFNARQELKDFVAEKLEKLTGIFERIERADVTLKIENATNGEDKVCEIRLLVPGNDLFAKRQAASFEEATNRSVDALYEQIAKLKTKRS